MPTGISLASVGTAILGGIASKVVGDIIGGNSGSPAPVQTVATPEVKAPTPMPVAPGASQKAKAEQSLAQQMSMNRASTTLTGDSDKLG